MPAFGVAPLLASPPIYGREMNWTPGLGQSSRHRSRAWRLLAAPNRFRQFWSGSWEWSNRVRENAAKHGLLSRCVRHENKLGNSFPLTLRMIQRFRVGLS